MRDEKHAIELMRANNVMIEDRAYGFCLMLDGEFAQCGMDNDSSISLSVDLGEPPVHWFFRISFMEMAEFIIEAFKNLSENPTREHAYQAMKNLDQSYDTSALDAKTDKFLSLSENTEGEI